MKKFFLFIIAVIFISWLAKLTNWSLSSDDTLPPELRKIASSVKADWDGALGQQVREACAGELGLKSAPKYEVDYAYIPAQDAEKYRTCLSEKMYPLPATKK